MLSKLLWKIGRPLGLHAATRFIRDVAEGKTDPRLTKAYWFMAGKKSWTALALHLAAAIALGFGDINAAMAIGAVGGFVLAIGLVDRSWRTDIPAEILNSGFYRFLTTIKAEIATALGGATMFFMSAECTSPDCGLYARACFVLTIVAVEFGLMSAAAAAPAPYVSVAAMVQAQIAREEKAKQEASASVATAIEGAVKKVGDVAAQAPSLKTMETLAKKADEKTDK